MVDFEVLYRWTHARKHALLPVPRGGRTRWSVPLITQRRRMNRSCYRKKTKEKMGHLKSSGTLRRSFSAPSPSCARVVLSNSSSMTRTKSNVRDECRIIRRCCCWSLTTAKIMTSFLVVAISRSGLCYFLSKRGVQVGRLRTMGVPIYFPVNITASEVLPQYHRQITIYFTIILVHLTGQRIVLAVKNYIDGIRYLDISPKKSGCKYN